MKHSVTVLGGGMVGGFVAVELAADPALDVTLVDVSRDNLQGWLARAQHLGRQLRTQQADLTAAGTVEQAVEHCELAVGCVPGRMGYSVLERVLQSGRNAVDISFFPEDARGLSHLAASKGVCAIVDCGVMPGLGGMLALDLINAGEQPRFLSIKVGGLPQTRRLPLEYKAPFSPADVIEEYLRPARIRSAGATVSVPALSGVELVDFQQIGTLEAFYTDGLRSLLHTLEVPDMEEKTLRYPGTAQRMQFLRDLGFFSEEQVSISQPDGARALVSPLSVTSSILHKHWQLEPEEEEFTVMRVELVSGADSSELLRTSWELLDFGQAPGAAAQSATSSMSRTTGYPAVLASQLLLRGLFFQEGIVPAELLAAHVECWTFMQEGLREAGVKLERRGPSPAGA